MSRNRLDLGANFTDQKNLQNMVTLDNEVGPGRAFFRGSSVTRAAVLAELPNAPLGSIYIAPDRMYLRLNDAGTATDWQRFTTSAAD